MVRANHEGVLNGDDLLGAGSRQVMGGAILNDRIVIISVISCSWVLFITLAFWRVSLLSRGEASPCDPALLQGQKILT